MLAKTVGKVFQYDLPGDLVMTYLSEVNCIPSSLYSLHTFTACMYCGKFGAEALLLHACI